MTRVWQIAVVATVALMAGFGAPTTATHAQTMNQQPTATPNGETQVNPNAPPGSPGSNQPNNERSGAYGGPPTAGGGGSGAGAGAGAGGGAGGAGGAGAGGGGAGGQ